MKILSFLFSFFLFSVYLLNHRKREEQPQQQQIPHDTATSEKAYKEYYSSRIETLHKMLEAAIEEEQREQAKLNHIKTLNQYGMVVNDKNRKRTEADLYKAQRKRLAIENQIYITEKRRMPKWTMKTLF